MRTSLLSALLFVAISFANAGQETLVLLDSLAIRETHSIFFKSLSGNDSTGPGVPFSVAGLTFDV